MFETELHVKQALEYLRDAESLSAYHSPPNYRKTGHHLSKNGLHHPVSGMVGEKEWERNREDRCTHSKGEEMKERKKKKKKQRVGENMLKGGETMTNYKTI